MNTRTVIVFMAVAAMLLATSLMAQPSDDRPRGPRDARGPQDRPQFRDRNQERPGRPMPPPPIIAALDANHDGELSSEEIDNAAHALRSLDKNGDGKLTREELRPAGRGPRGDIRGDRGEQRGPRPQFQQDGRRGEPRGEEFRGRGREDRRPGRPPQDGYGEQRRERRER